MTETNVFLNFGGYNSQLSLGFYDQPTLRLLTLVSLNPGAGATTTLDIADGAQFFLAFSNAEARVTNDDTTPTNTVGMRLFNVPRNVIAIDHDKPLRVFTNTSGWTTFYWLAV